jgi:hypothetical protein
VVSSHFWLLVVPRWSSSWLMELTGLTSVSVRTYVMLCTGLTGAEDQSDQSELSWCNCSILWRRFVCIHLGELHWFRGSLYVCRGLFVVFELCLGGLCSLLELDFVSVVSRRCPCLRGSRLSTFMWSCSFAFGWLSIASSSFFLVISFLFLFSLITKCVCCQCTHQGGDWEPVWF